MRRTLIVDTETTSLFPDYENGTGVIWELAIVEHGSGAAKLWRMKPDLAKADPGALRVGQFYERTKDMCARCERPDRAHDLTTPLLSRGEPEWSHPATLAAEVARDLDDATIVGANPAFDAAFLTAFLRCHGQAPTWHYRLRDIGSMAWAWLAARGVSPEKRPLDAGTDYLAEMLGVYPDKFERHSALGDCLLVGAMLDVISGGKP